MKQSFGKAQCFLLYGEEGAKRRRKGMLCAINTLLVREVLLLHVCMQVCTWAPLVCQVQHGWGCHLARVCTDTSVLELFSQSLERPCSGQDIGSQLPRGHVRNKRLQPVLSLPLGFMCLSKVQRFLQNMLGNCLQVMVSAQTACRV